MAAILEEAAAARTVLEIGPGPGILTRPLSLAADTVAVELDPRMAAIAAEFAPAAEVLCEDALTADLAALIASRAEPRMLVSNMPYAITGPLLGRAVELAPLLAKAVLMMQKEVGDRILAPAGDSRRGSLSVAIESVFQVRKVCSVPPGAFVPPPKVDSIVLSFTPLPEGPQLTERQLRAVRSGFAQPRKTLANNLKAAGLSLEFGSLPPSVRPHQLTLDQWKDLLSPLG